MQNDRGLLDLAAEFRQSADRLAKESVEADDIAELREIFAYHDRLVREDDSRRVDSQQAHDEYKDSID